MPKSPAPDERGKIAPQSEIVVQLPLSELHDFQNHPFKVRDDESMQDTAESVRTYGVLVPAIVRPREGGGYEIVAGQKTLLDCRIGTKTYVLVLSLLIGLGNAELSVYQFLIATIKKHGTLDIGCITEVGGEENAAQRSTRTPGSWL